ncbi:Protein white [Gryllus bimaculatus]|nr:Protein white [Gryllus bimaculatus]
MFMKKALALLRGWVLLLVHFLLPVLFLIIAILMGRMWEVVTTLPSRDISLQEYTEPRTVLAKPNGFSNQIVSDFINTASENYKNTAKDSNLTLLEDENPERRVHLYLLDEFRKNEAETRRSLIAGASLDVNNTFANFVGWFNDQPYHSAPLALNLLYNAFLKAVDVSLDLINYPLPYTHESQASLIENGNSIGFQIAFNFGFSMAFVASYYILFPIKERISKAKHLQFVSGVNVIVFWGVHLLCDFVSFLLPALGVIITLAAFQEDGFATFSQLGRTFAVLLCFGWAMLPLMYLSSFFFTIPASGYTRMAIFNLFIGNAGLMVVSILQIPGIDQQNVANILQHILMIVPHYSMADAISSLSTYSSYVDICIEFKPACDIPNFCCPDNCPSTGCVSVPANYFQFGTPGIGKHILYLLGMGCVFNIILLLVEFHCFDWLRPSSGGPARRQKKQGEEISPEEEIDSDVLEEKEKICSSEIQELTNNFSLVLRDVTKYYGRFLAVDHICIGVKKGECFGLLGVNGAGKTTTFKMMTGDENHIKQGRDPSVHQLIGYCPQFDALIEEMTGRETLRMFCLLRGIPAGQIYKISQDLADELLFTKHLDKKVKEYSGGNKRKLSTAVALIGDPPVVFLDEPTTGMDPVAKRHLWNVICKVRDRGKSIILTSHSMEECEALCTRLVIMVNGTFRCLGSTQHLKNKFAEGYTLIIKVGNPSPSSPVSRTFSVTSISSLTPDVTAVKNFVDATFPGALLREDFMGLLTYYIPSSTLTWSQMFGIMERAKQELHIEDYSLGQTSLEQVFLSFTKSQVVETIL